MTVESAAGTLLLYPGRTHVPICQRGSTKRQTDAGEGTGPEKGRAAQSKKIYKSCWKGIQLGLLLSVSQGQSCVRTREPGFHTLRAAVRKAAAMVAVAVGSPAVITGEAAVIVASALAEAAVVGAATFFSADRGAAVVSASAGE